MSTSYYQATEAILYSYSRVTGYIDDLNKKLVETEKSDWSNIKSVQYDKVNCRVFGIAMTTEKNALAKVEFIEELNKELIENKKFISSIENVLNRLETDEKQIIELLYFKNIKKEKAMKILKISEKTFYKLKKSSVRDFSIAWFGIKALSEF